MIWQDAVFTVGSLVFATALWPTVRDPRALVPRTSSVPTAVALACYVPTELSLGLRVAPVLTLFTPGGVGPHSLEKSSSKKKQVKCRPARVLGRYAF